MRWADRQKRLSLSRFLHNLGICLHFQNNPSLKNRLILKPNWATTAIYKILDNPRIKTETLGHFNDQDLDRIWHEDQYQDMRHELLQLMLEFKVCYEIPRRKGHYIAPHLLTHNTPTYPWHPTPGDLSLRYRYKRFMPKGILTRFIVEQHKRIENVSEPDRAHVWKTGVILIDHNTRAEIIEKYSDREIILRFTGPHQRDLLTQLKTTLDDIHDDFTRRDAPTTQNPLDYDIVIPCNCSTCNINSNPHFFSLEDLHTFINKRIDTMQCYKSGDGINVRRLLDNTIAPTQYRQKDRDRYGFTRDEESGDRYNNQRPIIISPTFINSNKQEQTVTEQSPKTTNLNFTNANIGAIATDNATATVSNNAFTQTHNTSTEDLLKLITTLRQAALQFPQTTQEELTIAIEDLEAEIIKPKTDRNPTRLKQRFAAITAAIGILASGASGLADFTSTAIDLGEKLNIDVPALIGQ